MFHVLVHVLSLAYLGCESLVLKHLMDQLEERILQTDQLKKAFVVSH